jgi:hypothetical protein
MLEKSRTFDSVECVSLPFPGFEVEEYFDFLKANSLKTVRASALKLVLSLPSIIIKSIFS